MPSAARTEPIPRNASQLGSGLAQVDVARVRNLRDRLLLVRDLHPDLVSIEWQMRELVQDLESQLKVKATP